MMKKFCVYVIFDLSKLGIYNYGNYSFSYEPIYVGQGTYNRPYEHFPNRNYDRKNDTGIFRERNVTFKYLSKELSKDDAIELESILITTIGRADKEIGPLLNRSDGGCSGWGKGIICDRTYMLGKNNPMHKIESTGSKNFNAKFCYLVKSPVGKTHHIGLGDLPQFCGSHNLPYSTFKGVKSDSGWVIKSGRAKGWFIQRYTPSTFADLVLI